MTQPTHLVVVHPFGDYQRGDRIEGDDAQKVLDAGHRSKVNPVVEPEPEPAPAKKAKTSDDPAPAA